MATNTKPALLALLLGGALACGPAFAQGTPAPAEGTEAAAGATEAPADATAAAPEATDAPAQAVAGAPAEGPAAGDYYVRETQGDWQLRCVKSPNGVDPCELFQLLKDNTGNPVAELTLIPLNTPQVAAGMTLTAPLETDLRAGVGFQIDAGEMRAYPFSVCATIGCVAQIGLPPAEVDQMRKGAKGKVVVLPYGLEPPEGLVELPVSLSGFTAAYKALETYIAEARAAAAAAPTENSDAVATEAPADKPAEAPAN